MKIFFCLALLFSSSLMNAETEDTPIQFSITPGYAVRVGPNCVGMKFELQREYTVSLKDGEYRLIYTNPDWHTRVNVRAYRPSQTGELQIDTKIMKENGETIAMGSISYPRNQEFINPNIRIEGVDHIKDGCPQTMSVAFYPNE